MYNRSIETAIKHLSSKGYHISETWLRDNKNRVSVPEKERIPIICNNCGRTREIAISHACNPSQKNPCPQCRAQGQLDRRFGAGHIKILEYGGEVRKPSKLYCAHSEQIFKRRIDSMINSDRIVCVCSSMSRHRSTWEEVKNEAFSRGYELLGNHKDEDIIRATDRLTLLCKKHGAFNITFSNFHNKGYGCSQCGREAQAEKRKFTKEEAQDKIDEAHGKGRYIVGDDYVNMDTNCTILCTRCGKTRFVTARNVASGRRCSCETESKGESFTSSFLDYMRLRYEKQVKFSDCRYKKLLPFDFKVYNSDGTWFLLEFDGIRHFKSVKYWGGKKALRETQLHDRIKNEYCERNRIFLIRVQNKKRAFKPSDRKRVVKKLEKARNIMAFFSEVNREHP